MEKRRLGKTNIEVSSISYGGSPLGGVYGDNDIASQIDSVQYAISKGINFIDTSPYYGSKLSETVLGDALKGVPRDKYYLGTKVGRYGLSDFNFSYDTIIASVKESMQRMGVDYLDVVQCHDIEFGDLGQVINESIPALLKLKSDGLVRHIGVTGYPLSAIERVVEARGPCLDVILSYCHYTLNDSTLQSSLPVFQQHDIGVINASFLNMGMLTNRGPPAWHPAPDKLKQKCVEAAELCKSRGSDISKLALQFATMNPSIHTNLVGMPCRQQVDLNLETLSQPIDDQLLQDVLELFKPLKDLIWTSGKPENN
ncbi:aldo-keto reductase [Cavenderia fasciculata]|uniref:Aldo-keto reductase n=1 Tax=Cavenderia fasciculata TaxID=261658 RepID=F4PPM4_CACFS|nr:aldo-keto reductase [Cavenderia fasciculata]EGG22337.1 aldo-keto reductase [Cavenderia fasciculata]|eukprot:XP_004360188.1 aldo-keto reductase [Cavenderia fasciculata]